MTHAQPFRPDPPPLHEMMQGLVNRDQSMISYLQSEGLVSNPVNTYSGHELDTNYSARVVETARKDMLANSELPRAKLEPHQIAYVKEEPEKEVVILTCDPMVMYRISKKKNEDYTILDHFQIDKIKGKYQVAEQILPKDGCEVITIDDICEKFKEHTCERDGEEVNLGYDIAECTVSSTKGWSRKARIYYNSGEWTISNGLYTVDTDKKSLIDRLLNLVWNPEGFSFELKGSEVLGFPKLPDLQLMTAKFNQGEETITRLLWPSKD